MKNKLVCLMTLFLYLLTPIFAPIVVQGKVLLRSESAPPILFKEFLHKNPKYIGFADFEYQKSLSLLPRHQLTQDFLNAQKDYFQNKINQARQNYQHVTHLSLKHDWPRDERELICYSWLQLFRLSSNTEKDSIRRELMTWIEDCPKRILSPEVQMVLNQVRSKTINSHSWTLPEAFHNYDLLIVNGQPFRVPLPNAVHIGPGTSRVSAYSHSHPSFHVNISINDLKNISVPRNAMASGSCQNPNLFHNTESRPSTEVFYSTNCIRSINELGQIPSVRNHLNSTLAKKRTPLFKKKLSPAWYAFGVIAAGFAATYRPKKIRRITYR